MFRFQKCLFAMRSSRLQVVLRPPAQCIRFAPSAAGAVYYCKNEIGKPLSPSDLSGVSDLISEEVLQVLVVGVCCHQVMRS